MSISSWPPPLVTPHESAVNPAFFERVVEYFTAIITVVGIFQLSQLLLSRSYGINNLKYRFGSVAGLPHKARIISALFFFALLISLASNSNSTGVIYMCGTVALATGAVFLPIQILEPTRSTHALASPLLFWLGTSLWLTFAIGQNSLLKHKLLDSTGGNWYEYTLLILSLASLILEIAFWSPTLELKEYYALNEWRTDKEHNLFSTLTFYWVQKVISNVYRTDEVVFEELVPAPDYMRAESSSSTLEKSWQTILKNAKKDKDGKSTASLLWALVKSFYPLLLLSLFLGFSNTVSEFIQPFLLNRFIGFFTASSIDTESTEKPPIIIGYFIACLMFATSSFRFLLFNQYYSLIFNLGFVVELSLKTLVYNKALRLSPEAKKNKTTGDIINNITTDILTIEWFIMQLEEFILTPLKFILCLTSLHKFLKNATWGGLATAVVCIPILSLVSMSYMKLYPILMKYSDERTTLTTEILNGIKSIKLYSWEKPMLRRLSDVRNGKELQTLKTIGVLSAFSIFLWNCTPFFILVASFTSFVYLYDLPLTPEIVFPVLLLFDLLTEPINMLPALISQLMEARTSLKRLSDLLLLDEIDSVVKSSHDSLKVGEPSIKVSGASFVWTSEKNKPIEGDEEAAIESSETEYALKDINFIARKGQLTCVVGRVGSGKTTLFKALLGDIPLDNASKSTASIEINGSIAYCSQQPWILNGSVKENILFGCKYDKDFYNKTIEACELVADFKSLPDADFTVVGEKGISLSGGQKARISLARAVYSRADIYFLDDVLSAVDAHVGKNLIQKVLGPNGLIASKTRVLCTNSVPVLHDASDILLLKKGRFEERGTFEEVMARNSDLAKLIRDFGRKGEDAPSSSEQTPNETATTTRAQSPEPLVSEVAASIGLEAPVSLEDQEAALDKIERVLTRESIGRASVTSHTHIYQDDIDPNSKTGNVEEQSEKGRVKLAVFLEYFKACNWIWIAAYVVLTLGIYQLSLAEKAVLTRWSKKNSLAGKTVDSKFYLLIYFGIGILSGIINLLSSYLLWTLVIIRGARYFHDSMINRVVRSPMRFFETTPVGRILNRFTDDVGVVDQRLPWIFIMFFSFISNGVITFGAIIFTLPAMSIVIGALLYVYNFIRKIYIPSLRELKRLGSKSKSPQIAHVQELINGVDTVRAYNQIDRFVHKNKVNIDKVITIEYNSQSSNRWLSCRLQLISSFIMFSSALLALTTLGTKNAISPSVLGFLMVYALLITLILNAIVRMWSDVETQTVAVERLIEYCNLPSEAPEVIEDNRPPKSWPTSGQISLNNYSTRYAENLDPVLKNINISINGNEKIGIVGRTGAGKSSLTLALFRIIEPLTGNISIDGLNTSSIGLFDLRKNLSIIPQDAHTVEGSVRQNLDPFSEYSDEQLWKALELAHLKEHVEQMKTEPTQKELEDSKLKDEEPETAYALDAKIYEGGSNLLAGQKQLLCLARALLNPLKILLLDEATAAVDVETDKVIQDTIRSEFKDKTILVIAHRLETIMDSDRIIVLDFGEVKEFDSPENLLKNKDGIFFLLCEKAGVLPK